MQRATEHPPRETLAAFVQGRLPPEEQARLEEHVAQCQQCGRQLAEIPSDTLVNALRAADTESLVGARLGSSESAEDAPSPLPSPSPASAEIGLELGNYTLLEKLGQGGMGAVFKAEHRRMRRLVALKLIAPHAMDSPEAARRFQREVQAAARLVHPNIVTAYDADEAQGRHFLAMELVDGEDLARRVRSGGPLGVAEAIDCVVQAARGLAYAHQRGIVHRDIKPANLLLDRSGTVKVLDMGLARLEEAAELEHTDLTASEHVFGTVDFMSPEQALSSRRADQRADIYSLGITLWYLLTGRVVYEGASKVEKIVAHREQPIPSLRTACPAASEALEAVFRQMVAKQPEKRYQTMDEVIAALETARDASVAEFAGIKTRAGLNSGESSYGDAVARPPKQTSWSAWQRGWLVVGGVAAAAIGVTAMAMSVAGLIGLWEFMQVPPSSAPSAPRAFDSKPQQVLAPPPELRTVSSMGVALSPNGQTIAVAWGSMDLPYWPGTIALVDRKSGEWTILGRHRHGARRVAFTPNGAYLVSVSGIATPHSESLFTCDVQIWNVAGKRLEKRVEDFPESSTLQSLAIEPQGKWCVVAGRNNDVRRLSIPGGEELGRYEVRHRESCSAVAISPDGELIAAASGGSSGHDSIVQVFRTDDESLVVEFPSREGEGPFISDLAFRSASELVGATGVTGGANAQLRAWDIERKVTMPALEHGVMHILAMGLSPDGRTVATGTSGEEGAVRLWDLDQGKLQFPMEGDLGGVVYGLAFSRDGQVLAAAGGNGRVHVWGGK